MDRATRSVNIVKKYAISGLLIALSAFFVTACSANRESDSDNYDVPETTSTNEEFIVEDWTDDVHIIGSPTGEYTYVRSDIPIGNDIDRISAITVIDNTVFGVAEIWSNYGAGGQIPFFSIDLDTNEVFFYPHTASSTWSYPSVHAITANADWDIFFVVHEFIFDSEVGVTKEYATLARIDTAGNIVFSVDISEHFTQHEFAFHIALDSAENIYVQIENGNILLFNSDGVYQSTIQRPEAAGSGLGLFQGADGVVAIPMWTPEDGNILYIIDYETHSMLPRQPLPDAHDYIPGVHENEMILSSHIGVYRYCLDNGERTRVFHWLEIDIIGSSIFPINEEQFVLLDFTNTRDPVSVTILTRTVMDDNRTVITFASLFPDYALIQEFNRQSSEYRIVILDYSDLVNNMGFSEAETRFKINLMTGRVPDIIELSSLGYRTLANAGFLTDLNTLFEYDDQINRFDFHERVFDLLEIGSNLYAVTPSFGIDTHFAPAALVGTSPGLTLEQLIQLDNQYNDGRSLLQNMYSQWFLERYMQINHSALIDYETGTAYFETDAFLQVLEYAYRLDRFVEGQHVAYYEFYPFEVSVRRGNNYISGVQWITELFQLHQMEYIAGREITAIGFPAVDGVGSTMFPFSLYGIGQGTQNISGAWAFIRFILAEERQSELFYWSLSGIPVSRAVFYEKIDFLINPPIIDSPHLAGGMYIDGVFVESTPMTQDDADRLLEIIETMGTAFTGGEEIIINIVMEEADTFFHGHRTAEETTRIIQNRVQRYLDEQR